MQGERNGQGHWFDHHRHRPVHDRTMRSAAGVQAEPYRNEHREWTLKGFSVLIIVGLLAWMLAGRLHSPASTITSAPTIDALKPLAALMTHRIVVVDALTITISGFTGDLRAAVLVRGDAMVSIDLTQARIEEINHEARTAVLVLTRPQVVSARVDHDHSHVFSIEASGLWALVPSDDGRAEVIDQAMRQAQRAVLKAASEPAVIEEARARAEALICAFFRDTLNWSVAVCWADVPVAR